MDLKHRSIKSQFRSDQIKALDQSVERRMDTIVGMSDSPSARSPAACSEAKRDEAKRNETRRSESVANEAEAAEGIASKANQSRTTPARATKCSAESVTCSGRGLIGLAAVPHKRHHEHISGMLPTVHHHDLSFRKTIAAVGRCHREGLQSSRIRGRLFRRNGQKIPKQRRTAKSSRCRAVDNTMKL
jgi:hypothetical protein